MFIDKVKKFCDHSMTLWEMAGDLLTNGLNPPPQLLGLKESNLANLNLKILKTFINKVATKEGNSPLCVMRADAAA